MINIVANIGINWFSKKPDKRAKNLVDKAIECGVNGIVVPTFSAGRLFKAGPLANDSQQYEIKPEVVYDLLQIADSNDVMFYLNPRDPEAVGYGESIGVDGYHIANGDILHTELLKSVGETKKIILLSTGFSLEQEIKDAIKVITDDADMYPSPIVLLHSTGGTPTYAKDALLIRILDLMASFFPYPVGLESFYADDFLDYVAMGYPNLWGVVRRFDLADNLGIEADYSIGPDQLVKLVKVAQAMEQVINVETFGNTGFSETDFEARRRLLRLPKDNFLLPPSCCPDSE